MIDEPRRRWRGRVALWLGGAALLVAMTLVATVASVRISGTAPVGFGGAAEVVTLPHYGDGGSHILNYAHGDLVTLTFPLTNTGRLPVTVTAVRLGDRPLSLLEPQDVVVGSARLPMRLDPGKSASVVLTAREGNCRYFHEREIELFPAALVDLEVLGVNLTRRVAFDHEIVVHSPMIVGCPDRTLDRSDDIRPR
ncbi:MAG TPA: hypothetical protein VFB78_12915 [Acidimicrobiales bacterium]|nr:hypothetical protein [Acidimicrobiales bacterium]